MKASKKTNTSYPIIIMIFVSIFITESCNSEKNDIYWVNSIKSDCPDSQGQMNCLLVHKGTTKEAPQWELFYSTIEGFTFEPGYFQKIEIKQEHLDKDNLAADTTGHKYSLVHVLEKQKDSRFALNSKWVLKSINGNVIGSVGPDNQIPTMEFKLSEWRVFGTNGCNNYSAGIENITFDSIRFGLMMSTKKMCLEMTIPDSFDRVLFNSVNYQVKDHLLIFTDVNGKETLSFKKVD